MLTYKNFFQVAYVTHDMDKALALFDREQGIKKFMVFEATTPVDKKGNTALMRTALAYVGEIQVEILQPLAGSTQVWQSKVPAAPKIVQFHHLAFLVDGMAALEAARAAHARNGHKVAVEVGIPDVGEGIYVDTYDSLGHYMEYIYFMPKALEYFASIPRF